ncbi:MAG: DNA internalization-related competence protein ComEC/Rec2 [Oscillospiraceae bacterium]|nr:DNA internalization-related competence protein ComEC/Rec2 [Oscillospiraceae bacterium]
MRKLMWFGIGFATATAVLVYFFGGVCFPLALAFLLIPLLLFFPKRPTFLLFLLAGISLGAVYTSFHSTLLHQRANALCGEKIAFTATVKQYPKETKFGETVLVKLEDSGLSAKLYTAKFPALRPGDILTATGEFQKTPYRPSETDDLYYESLGITLTGSVEEVSSVTAVEHPPLLYTMARWNKSLQERVKDIFPSSSTGFFTALITGERSGIGFARKNQMALCGVYHAVSISGMHVSILMGMVIFLCRNRRKLSALLGVPILLAFLLLSGGSSATARAVFMYLVLLLAGLSHREYDALTAMAFALILLLLENPYAIAQWGLQLSFLSTAGILVLCPKILQSYRDRRPKGKVLRMVTDVLVPPMALTLSATTLSLPVMALNFGVVSLSGFFTNLLTLWAVSASFLLGILTVLLSFLLPTVASFFGSILHYLYVWICLVLDVFSALPFSAVDSSQPILLLWSALWQILLLCWALGKNSWKPTFLCGALSLILAITLTAIPTPREFFTMLDVGQGQCLILHTEGKTYLIDCGGNAEETGEIATRYLRQRGIFHIDGIFLTHFDADHTEGLEQLLTRTSAKNLYHPTPTEEETAILAPLEELVSLHPITQAMLLPLKETTLRVYPVGEAKDGVNESGLCILASGKKCDILITGDLNTEGELELLAQYDLPDLEILVAGHHGSRHSTSRTLLDTLQPELALISVGENNYSHPHDDTLSRLQSIGAEVYTTLDNGNLTIRW